MKQYKSNLDRVLLKREKTDFKKVKIRSSKDASDYIRNFYFEDIDIFESFFVLLLNRANNTIGYAKISQGGITSATVDVILVAKYAIDSLASGVILAHNHPSGNFLPSSQDKDLTSKIKQGLKLFNVSVLDHVILTSDDYYSFADNGFM